MSGHLRPRAATARWSRSARSGSRCARTRDHLTRISNQVRDLVLTAPEQLRSELDPLTTAQRVHRCAGFRPGDVADPAQAAKLALRTLARQYESLDADLDELREHLDRLTAAVGPALRAAKGIGPDVASILLIAAGDNPRPAHKTKQHSPPCAAPARSRRPQGEPSATASTKEATARPTTPCGASPWSA